jgi:hypothetical protein
MAGISFLVYEYDKKTIQSIFRQNNTSWEIIIPKSLDKEFSFARINVKVIPDCRNIVNFILKSYTRIKYPYYCYLPKGVRLSPEFVSKILSVFEKDKACRIGFVYSDYCLVCNNDMKEVKLYDYNRDFTERFNFGYIKVYSKDSVDAVKGYNSNLATYIGLEYDLQLKFWEKEYALYHLPQSTYQMQYNTEEKDKCGSGGLFAAFRYLQLPKKEEHEIENIFKNFLKRNNAYLKHKNPKIVYPKEQKFSPLVSIVSPTYNREKWIKRTIESVLAQTFKDWELIFVDNASTDRTVNIIEEYIKKDKRIKLIKNRIYHKGAIAHCLNQGLSIARGKYYAQLDSDDEYFGNTLEEMVSYLESHPYVGLAISYYVCIDENSEIIKELGVIKHLEYDRNNILRCEGAGAVRVWHRRVIWEELGGFDEKNFGEFGEDYDLLLKTSERYDVGRVHKVLYKYRRHSEVTDVTRDPYIKLKNKTLARLNAFYRRIEINKSLNRK